MKSNNPLKLAKIELCNYSPDAGTAPVSPRLRDFDSRSDFYMDSSQTTMTAALMFTNERILNSSARHPVGLRRKVSVSILDVTAGEILHTAFLRVSFTSDEYIRLRRIDLPLPYETVDTDHSYKVLVRDECSKRLLGEKVFHLYDAAVLGPRPYEWYKVRSGGLCSGWDDEMCLCVYIGCHDYYRIRFNLEGNFAQDPLTPPELEMRLYAPDGKVESWFVRPCSDNEKINTYHVERQVIPRWDYQGVYYVEIICMDYPVAGFVFSTGLSGKEGVWEGRHLECMKEYSLAEATGRLRDSLREVFGKDVMDEVAAAFADEEEPAAEEEEEITEEDIRKFLEPAPPAEAEDDKAAENRDEPEKAGTAGPERQLITLDHLTGLKSVKEKLTVYERVVRFNKMRSDNGLPCIQPPLHAMFLGAAGTGKTTVAKMMGMMLRRAGVLSKGHVVVRERATLLGKNYNSESENTLKAIEEAQGGILFIDEAYQLFQPNDLRDPGKFVIETLLTSLADESKRDWMLILAGYPEEMRHMLDMNPGFKSRIPESNIYTFDDFTELELMEIAEKYLSRNRYSLTEEARTVLADRLRAAHSQREKNFGNARYVINLIQTDILPAMAVRVTSAGTFEDNALTEILPTDIPQMPPAVVRPRIGYTF